MTTKMFSNTKKSSNELPNLDRMLRDSSGVDGFPQLPPVPSTITKRTETKVQNTQNTTTRATVIIAKVVHVYKYDGGHYRLCEKLQIALIQTLKTEMRQILLYVNKQVIVSVTTITPDFSYVMLKNNYCTYRDDNKCLWSIKFDDMISCIEVGREIILCKYFSVHPKKNDSVLFQDLINSDDECKVEEGDTVTLTYAIVTNIVQPMKISTVLDQKMVVTITSDDTWEKYLTGVSKASRRIFILPSSKQISLGPGFPKDMDIILETEIIEIEKSTKPLNETLLSVNINKTENDKASLLSRMAKMGHSILPKQSTSSTDSENSEDEEERKISNHKKAFVKTNLPQQINRLENLPNISHKSSRSRSKASAVHNSYSSSIPSTLTSPVQLQQQFNAMENQAYPVAQQSLASPIPVALDPNLYIFLSETRTHNAEIRMGMSKIADNVQKLLDKFHTFEVQNAVSPINNTTIEALKVLLAINPNALQTNNVKALNGDSENGSSEINRLTKIIEEKDHLLQEKEISLQNVQQFIAKKEELERINMELNKKVEDFEMLQNYQTEELNEMLQKIKLTKTTIVDCRNENIKLKAKINELSKECHNLDIQQAVNEKNDEIKTIMHRLYREIMNKFTEETYKTQFINKIIGSTIRAVTLEVLNEKKSPVKYESNSSDNNASKDSTTEQRNDPVTNSISNLNVKSDSANENDSSTESISSTNEEPSSIPPMDINIQND